MMDWVPLTILVGLISLLITILVDMFSRAFGFQSAAMWAKSEYAQVAATFAIILLADAVSVVGMPIVGEVAYAVATVSGNAYIIGAASSNVDPTLIAKAYLEKVIECERNIYRGVYLVNIFVEAFSKVSFDIAHLEAVGAGIALSGWVSLFHYLMGNIVYLVLFHYVQYNILLWAQYVMLPVFLPIGLIMRAFSITRGAGGFVIGFALGFAFVFPMTYVIIVSMMPAADIMCSKIQVYATPGSVIFGPENPCFNNAGQVMDAYYRIKNSESSINDFVDKAQVLGGLLWMQAIFYPLAALIITLSFVRQTGSLFGADLAEIGRGLIKLI